MVTTNKHLGLESKYTWSQQTNLHIHKGEGALVRACSIFSKGYFDSKNFESSFENRRKRLKWILGSFVASSSVTICRQEWSVCFKLPLASIAEGMMMMMMMKELIKKNVVINTGDLMMWLRICHTNTKQWILIEYAVADSYEFQLTWDTHCVCLPLHIYQLYYLRSSHR